MRMRFYPYSTLLGIVVLAGVTLSTFYVDGLQYTVPAFVPILLLMSVAYWRIQRRGIATLASEGTVGASGNTSFAETSGTLPDSCTVIALRRRDFTSLSDTYRYGAYKFLLYRAVLRSFICHALHIDRRSPCFNRMSRSTCWKFRNGVRGSIGSCSHSRSAR